MGKTVMVLMLTALAACPLAVLLMLLGEALGWRRAEQAVLYVFAGATACFLAAIIGVVWGVIHG